MHAPRLLPGYTDDFSFCSKRHITERELRHDFATYHELHPGDLHRSYQDMGCVIEGEIRVDNKVFHFAERPINLLVTDWPDGVRRGLGGAPSDESDMQ